jgi:indolepyruvate ferredoxin oxidoreductase alpha subunit
MVALEVAAGAAILGLRAIASMKHVGMNWAVDPLMVINQTGVEGGLLIVSADDPGGHSSQNEQDSRNFGKFAEILVLEPSSVAEAKEMARKAFELSEEVKLPVILRTVTRISHARGMVSLGDIKEHPKKPYFNKYSYPRWICKGIYTVTHHRILHEKNRKLKEIVEILPFNQVNIFDNSSKFGIVASGIGYAYAKEALNILALDNKVNILKVGTPYPLPGYIQDFLKLNNKVLIVEEGSPLVEEEIRAAAFNISEKPEIYGRLTGIMPAEGEITPNIVAMAVANALGLDYHLDSPERMKVKAEAIKKIPSRPFVLCAGCPHRSTLYILKLVLKEINKEGVALVASDMGCYGTGSASLPFNIADTLLCMGGGIGVANGFAAAGWFGPIIALIGDSTFMHAGVPALINAVYNRARFMLLVMDNSTTAMTGMQDHPGTGVTATGAESRKIHIEDIARAIGVDYVKVVDPYNFEDASKIMKEAINVEGVSVVIARRQCVLRNRGVVMKTCYVNEERCNGCGICIKEFACPAFRWNRERGIVSISASDCVGCGFCKYVCPNSAIFDLNKNCKDE